MWQLHLPAGTAQANTAHRHAKQHTHTSLRTAFLAMASSCNEPLSTTLHWFANSRRLEQKLCKTKQYQSMRLWSKNQQFPAKSEQGMCTLAHVLTSRPRMRRMYSVAIASRLPFTESAAMKASISQSGGMPASFSLALSCCNSSVSNHDAC